MCSVIGLFVSVVSDAVRDVVGQVASDLLRPPGGGHSRRNNRYRHADSFDHFYYHANGPPPTAGLHNCRRASAPSVISEPYTRATRPHHHYQQQSQQLANRCGGNCQQRQQSQSCCGFGGGRGFNQPQQPHNGVGMGECFGYQPPCAGMSRENGMQAPSLYPHCALENQLGQLPQPPLQDPGMSSVQQQPPPSVNEAKPQGSNSNNAQPIGAK